VQLGHSMEGSILQIIQSSLCQTIVPDIFALLANVVEQRLVGKQALRLKEQMLTRSVYEETKRLGSKRVLFPLKRWSSLGLDDATNGE
jgi:hypothetical protein